MTADPPQSWRIGVIGLGVAGRGTVAAAAALGPRARVTVASDPAVSAWPGSDGVRLVADAEAVCRSDDVDVVYVASPSSLHAGHAVLAARAGKHLLIEKPMGASLADCSRIVDVAAEHGVHVVAAHTPSFEAPLRTARAIVVSGEVGRPLHLTQVKYAPWLIRPRLPEELDNARGGGVVNRQAPHQIDAALFLIGTEPRTVYATVGGHPDWPATDGHYTAVVTFADGAVATMVFNGYGYFTSAALTDGVGEDGYYQQPGAGQRLRALQGASKEDMRSGVIHEVEHGYAGAGPRYAAMSSWTLLSCEGADLVLSPTGVMVHRPDGIQQVPFASSGGYLADALDELDGAVAHGNGPLHDARWGRRVVAVVAAVHASAEVGRPVSLDEPAGLTPGS